MFTWVVRLAVVLSMTTGCSSLVAMNAQKYTHQRSVYVVSIGFKSFLRKTIASIEPSCFADMGNVCTRLRIDLPTSVNVTVFRVEIDYYWNMNMSTNMAVTLFVCDYCCVVYNFWCDYILALVQWSLSSLCVKSLCPRISQTIRLSFLFF